MTDIHPSPEPAEARAQHRFEVLRELADIGMELARDVRRQVAEPAVDGPTVDFALVFSRIARAVRQTVALEAKLDEERQARHDQAEADRAVKARVRGIRRKARVGGIVEHVLDSESDAERLLDDLNEHLADADDTDFADRPVGEMVAAICRDLGVTVDWSLWEDERWAIEALNAERAETPDMAPPQFPPAANASPDRPSLALSG